MAIREERPWLVVAAEPLELAGILRHCRGRKRLRWPVRFARAAVLGAQPLVLVANGCGARLAGEACEVAWNKQRAAALFSVGTCGALEPALRPGDILVANQVAGEDGTTILEADPINSSLPHVTGRLISMDHVVRSAREKQILRGEGASAVEMEALAVGLRARHWGVPFHCVKAVTDLAGEDLELDFNAARLDDGRLSTVRILGAAARRPFALAPELLKLYYRSQLAARALGDFLADCRL